MNVLSVATVSPLLLLSLLFAIVGCGPSSNGSLNADSNVAPALLVPAALGSGYDSAKSQKRAVCVDPAKFVYAGSPISNVSYLRDLDQDELTSELSVGPYGKASLFGLLSAKVSGDIIMTLTSTEDTSAFVYKFDVEGKSAVLSSPRLSAFGMEVYKKKDPLYFRDQCGDEFVEQVKYGAQLFIGVKYTFTSREEKEKLLIKLQGSALWGLIKFSKEWSKEERDMLKNISVGIEAYQVGGDPRALETVKNGISLSACAGNDIERCGASLESLITYARTGFSAQLNELEPSTIPFKGPAVLSVTTLAYSNQPIFDADSKELIFLEVDSSTTTFTALAAAIRKLEDLQLKLGIGLNRVKSIQYFALDPLEKATLQVTRRNLEDVIAAALSLQNDTCSVAMADNKLSGKCVAGVGDMQIKAAVALKAVSIPSR